MDYKKIFKSRSLRLKILRMLSFVPDKTMIKLQYKMKTGHRLDLKQPLRYTEKLQWYKLYYKNPIMIQCVDKYDVRDYVKNKGLENILIPCFGVFDSADNIDWNSLPNQFVLKDTLGGGGSSVLVVKDKNSLNIDETKKVISKWLSHSSRNVRDGGREWPYYSGKKHRIIIEGFLDSNELLGGLIDYKFLCFNGKISAVYVLADRKMGQDAGCGIFDEDLNLLPFNELDERPLERVVEKPDNYDLMKEIAKLLSADFPEARIDLYNVDGKIYFGEITFYDSSGYMLFDPDRFDYVLGEKFVLPQKWLLK